jgi:NAD(P)H dehydrogenase (quinone)
MRWLVIYAHPDPDSFCAALRDAAVEALAASGEDVEVIDLYALDFAAAMTDDEHRRYEEISTDHPDASVRSHIEIVGRVEGIVFVYPTWWSSLPAILKGWLDRVLLPGVGFHLNTETRKVEPGLRHITRLVAITTYGGPRWLERLKGDGGRTIITRTLWLMTSRRTRWQWLALDRVEQRSAQERQEFVETVKTKLGKLA